MLMLFGFAGAALWKVGTGAAPGHLSFDADWFNPFSGLTIGAFVVGVTGSVFAFWGWDTCLTLGEESKDPDRVPGRAGLLSVASILLTYLLVAVALTMYAGVGTTGLGLGNPANEENIFGALADPVLGPFFGPFLSLAVLASAVAGLQTTFLPLARVMLAMGVYGAVPRRFAEISPRFLVPRFSTIVSSAVTAVFYTVVTVLSEHTLTDTIAALGIMICWYYGITAFACIWEFRHTLFRGVRNVVFRFLCPLLGGAMLLVIFAISIRESMDPANGSGSSIGGIGLVFFLGFGILALGVVLMLVQRAVAPRFFTENTWHTGSEKVIAETLVPECPEPAKDLRTV
ncbi:Putative amino acid transporter [Mycobacteroides abscessus subsp. massiliense]|nr:Putative amino acid transporter [Mycobacteroides abscessus subsp. massiliense]